MWLSKCKQTYICSADHNQVANIDLRDSSISILANNISVLPKKILFNKLEAEIVCLHERYVS